MSDLQCGHGLPAATCGGFLCREADARVDSLELQVRALEEECKDLRALKEKLIKEKYTKVSQEAKALELQVSEKRRCVQVVSAKLHQIGAGLEASTPGIDSPSILTQLTDAIMKMEVTDKQFSDSEVKNRLALLEDGKCADCGRSPHLGPDTEKRTKDPEKCPRCGIMYVRLSGMCEECYEQMVRGVGSEKRKCDHALRDGAACLACGETFDKRIQEPPKYQPGDDVSDDAMRG